MWALSCWDLSYPLFSEIYFHETRKRDALAQDA